MLPDAPPPDAGPAEPGQGAAGEQTLLTRFIMFEPAGVPAEIAAIVDSAKIDPVLRGDQVAAVFAWIATQPRATDPNPLTWSIIGSELGRDRKNATRRFYQGHAEPELHVAVSENAWRPERPPVAPFQIPNRVGSHAAAATHEPDDPEADTDPDEDA